MKKNPKSEISEGRVPRVPLPPSPGQIRDSWNSSFRELESAC
jgi:hypothetical protein